jgi:hypothetical protein
LPGGARLDRNECQPGGGQALLNALGERRESPQHFARRGAVGKIVIACIEQYQARPVLDDQLLEVLDAIGKTSAAEAALQHHGTAELTFEALP